MKISKRIKTLFINEHFEKFFKEINKSAEKITFKQIGKNVMIYPCGFAWIYFEKKSENEPFVQWLIREQKNGIYKCPLQKNTSNIVMETTINQCFINKLIVS